MLPLNEGIHKTGNCDHNVTVSVSVYGTPLRRPFIQGLDLSQCRIFRICSENQKETFLHGESSGKIPGKSFNHFAREAMQFHRKHGRESFEAGKLFCIDFKAGRIHFSGSF